MSLASADVGCVGLILIKLEYIKYIWKGVVICDHDNIEHGGRGWFICQVLISDLMVGVGSRSVDMCFREGGGTSGDETCLYARRSIGLVS